MGARWRATREIAPPSLRGRRSGQAQRAEARAHPPCGAPRLDYFFSVLSIFISIFAPA